MSKQPFSIIHNLDGLDKDAIKKYLSSMSAYIGLDPELSGLDTIYMNDPQGGRALVPYARRGTCEILRNLYEVEVESLTYATVGGSIVFTATGRSKKRGNRQEIAVGSKFVDGLRDKVLDNAIMTASTRALQRLTMQFTELGILAESEVVDLVGQAPNPAGSAQLADNPIPPAFLPPPAVPANNAPGKPVEMIGPSQDPKTQAQVAAVIAIREAEKAAPTAPVSLGEPFLGRPEQVQAVWEQREADNVAKKADKRADIPAAAVKPTPLESTTSSESEADKQADKPVKTRRKKNTVVLDVEPEVVSSSAPAHSAAQNPPKEGVSLQQISAPPPQVPAPGPAAAVTQTPTSSVSMDPVAGMPTKEQMDEYRKKISVYTVQLPPSQDLGPTQKMRAFITKMSGAAPQNMTVEQWEEVISFFNGFMERNQNNIKNLVKYIDDMLGVK